MSAEAEVADMLVEILAANQDDLFDELAAAQAFEVCEHLRALMGLEVSSELELRISKARRRAAH